MWDTRQAPRRGTPMLESIQALTDTVRAAAPDTPTRFARDASRGLRATRRLRRVLPRGLDPLPTAPEWSLLAQGLRQADPPADALAAVLLENGGKGPLWQQFEQALHGGLSAVQAPAPALEAFFHAVACWPDWVDPGRFREGAAVCALGGEPAMTAMLINGLLSGYQLSAINPVLVSTGQLEAAPGQRLGYTTRWFMDVTAAGGLDRSAPGFQTTLRVRLIHALVRQRLLASDWKTEELGVPINQVDLQVTLFGFSVVYLLGMRMLGIVTTAAERAAYLHRWRAAGWLLGIDAPFLSAVEDEPAALRALLHNVLQQPQADASTPQLARPLALEEPLTRTYSSLPTFRGHYTRAKGLSLARLSLGRDTLQDLGLPAAALPWYPVLQFLFNQPLHRIARGVPGGRGWLERRGRASQERALLEVGRAPPALTHAL